MNEPEALVILPTVGDPQLLLPTVQRLLECTLLPSWALTVVCNPVPQHASTCTLLQQQVEAAVAVHSATSGRSCALAWLQLDEAVGWPAAVNAGVEHGLQAGLPAGVCILNDDVLVTPGWLTSLLGSLEPQAVVLQGEVAHYRKEVPLREPAGYGRIGMVGPVSNVVAGAQRIVPPDVKLRAGAAFHTQATTLLDQFAQQLQRELGDAVMSATFLSGLCVLYRRECLLDLLEKVATGCGCPDPAPRFDVSSAEWDCVECGGDLHLQQHLLRTCYGVGGYDDNDAAARAQVAGWRLAIARGTYVHHLGHQTLGQHYPEAQLGLAGVLPYLRAWQDYTTREQQLVAVYRVGWSVAWDVAMLGASLRRTLQLVDGVALLATSSPAQALADPEIRAVAKGLPEPEQRLLADAQAAGDDAERLQAALDLYLDRVARSMELQHPVQVAAAVWQGIGNERDQRNEAIRLALQLGADWCLSVDHDEVAEDGVTRQYLQRLMAHPDPLVCAYDTGWANLWDSERLCRVDPPWADGYRSSMRGFRLWRVQHPHLQQIQAGAANGLHCGNVPDVGIVGKRVAGLRWKHYGYLRAQDRVRKWRRYRTIDPEPEQQLVQAQAGGRSGYDHLVNEEGMRLQPYRSDTRIGLTMLVHAGEQLHDVARHLSHAHGLVDAVVLVWTEQLDKPIPADWKYLGARYGVTWLHHPLADDLGTARNAGVEHLRKLGLDWCWVMDPDEHLQPPLDALVSLRRMVEVSDSWAWLFQFKNHRPGGQFAISENVRLFRLAGDVLRYGNRVHETLEASLQQLAARGVHPQVRSAPFTVEHYGLAGGDVRTQGKLHRYTRLLALQVRDEPLRSPGAWVSLGLQYGNDGAEQQQLACYDVACATAGTAFLPYREAALYHLRIGRRLLEQALQRLAPAHSLHQQTGQLLEVLRKLAPDQPKLGAARTGAAVPPDVDLQPLLDAAWAQLDAETKPRHDGVQEA